MAEKDATLVTDFSVRTLSITGILDSQLEIQLGTDSEYVPSGKQLFLVDLGTGGAGTYRMRGFDQNVSVNAVVYWNSRTVDNDASDYLGSAGPVVNIIVSDIIGD